MLPKRIAGVKIPKALRQQADHLVTLARNPLVSEVLIAGLAAVATGVLEKEKLRAAASAAKRKAEEAAREMAEAVSAATAPVEKAAKPAAPRRRTAPAAPRAPRKAPPKTTH